MDLSSAEVSTGLSAVLLASQLCQKVRRDLTSGATIEKNDRTPVTIADYGSQAIICKIIRENFPNDVIVGEEDSTELRRPERKNLLEKVTHYVEDFYPNTSSREVCEWIDFGTHTVQKRFWTLDPIDGTKGFLRGDQYAIALALIEEGIVKLGLMACPNLYLDRDHRNGKKGSVFLAVRGKGSFQMDMEGERGKRRMLSVSKVGDPAKASFTESIEPDHADHLTHLKIAQRLGMREPPLKMDSQAKYGMVARGEATFYLRVPSPSEPGYKEKIWDHAAGAIIAEEAGGKVTDLNGKSLDFSCGIRLEKNRGILASNGILHEVVLKALEV